MAVRRSAKALRKYQQRNRYNQVSGLEIRNSWWGLHDQVRKRAGGSCEDCGDPGSEPHHIIPLSKGGANTKANLIYLCPKCHDRRHRHLRRSRNNRNR